MTTKTHNPADKVERWAIEKLVPYARNARTHSDEQHRKPRLLSRYTNTVQEM